MEISWTMKECIMFMFVLRDLNLFVKRYEHMLIIFGIFRNMKGIHLKCIIFKEMQRWRKKWKILLEREILLFLGKNKYPPPQSNVLIPLIKEILYHV